MDSLNHNACIGENEVRTNNLKWKEKSSLDDGGHDCNWKNKFVPSDDESKELNVNASSIEEERPNEKQWREEWLLKQNESAESCSKDYVMSG